MRGLESIHWKEAWQVSIELNRDIGVPIGTTGSVAGFQKQHILYFPSSDFRFILGSLAFPAIQSLDPILLASVYLEKWKIYDEAIVIKILIMIRNMHTVTDFDFTASVLAIFKRITTARYGQARLSVAVFARLIVPKLASAVSKML